MKLYALHDKKAGSYSSFHVERSDAQASRGFADAVNQSGSVFGKYPEDFELVALGTVSDDASQLFSVEPSERIVILTASQVVALKAEPEAV